MNGSFVLGFDHDDVDVFGKTVGLVEAPVAVSRRVMGPVATGDDLATDSQAIRANIRWSREDAPVRVGSFATEVVAVTSNRGAYLTLGLRYANIADEYVRAGDQLGHFSGRAIAPRAHGVAFDVPRAPKLPPAAAGSVHDLLNTLMTHRECLRDLAQRSDTETEAGGWRCGSRRGRAAPGARYRPVVGRRFANGTAG